jgi:hypothetical protein
MLEPCAERGNAVAFGGTGVAGTARRRDAAQCGRLTTPACCAGSDSGECGRRAERRAQRHEPTGRRGEARNSAGATLMPNCSVSRSHVCLGPGGVCIRCRTQCMHIVRKRFRTTAPRSSCTCDSMPGLFVQADRAVHWGGPCDSAAHGRADSCIQGRDTMQSRALERRCLM